MFFPKILALILFFAPLVHLIPFKASLDDHDCECKYKETGEGGCVISRAARPGRACECYLSLHKRTCRGKVVECHDPKSASCKSSSDTSFSACQQGGGDCKGYPEYTTTTTTTTTTTSLPPGGP